MSLTNPIGTARMRALALTAVASTAAVSIVACVVDRRCVDRRCVDRRCVDRRCVDRRLAAACPTHADCDVHERCPSCRKRVFHGRRRASPHLACSALPRFVCALENGRPATGVFLRGRRDRRRCAFQYAAAGKTRLDRSCRRTAPCLAPSAARPAEVPHRRASRVVADGRRSRLSGRSTRRPSCRASRRLRRATHTRPSGSIRGG